MGCNCGNNGGSQLGNYQVKDSTGKVVKNFTAVKQIEVTAFAAKLPGATWIKTS